MPYRYTQTCCNEIAFVQAAKFSGDASASNVHVLGLPRKGVPWVSSEGWFVDNTFTVTGSPWYNYGRDGAPVDGFGNPWIAGNASPATLLDEPGHFRKKDFEMKFISCALCKKPAKGGQLNRIYGCIRWGFGWNDGKYYDFEPILTTKAPPEWYDAVAAWNAYAAKTEPADHDGMLPLPLRPNPPAPKPRPGYVAGGNGSW
jgi:hypothetical protein